MTSGILGRLVIIGAVVDLVAKTRAYFDDEGLF